MNEDIYTIIMDWNGGTYVSQVSAGNATLAKNIWSKNVNFSEIGAEETQKNDFLTSVSEEEVVSLKGIENVWCISPMLNKAICCVNIVKTVSSS